MIVRRRSAMSSLMLQEALAAAQAVATQPARIDEVLVELAGELKARPPKLALTVARGSSDHAASYFAYLVMRQMGLPVVSLPMSLITLHKAPLAVTGQLAVALSQSGRSYDLVDTMAAMRAAEATTVGFINHTDSPLAKHCKWVVPLCAGVEQSVAATKSYIAALAAIARLVAHWRGDASLLEALARLPDRLDEAAHVPVSVAVDALIWADSAMVVGRGLGFAVALEAALKLKETAAIQAEAFSGAEIRHGPLALVEHGYPLVIFALRGAEQAGLIGLARDLRQRGARVILAAPSGVPDRDLTLEVADDPTLDPILAIQTFYVLAARLAKARGLNPDEPPHLSKVTLTH
jgi:glucosamine--fructose-6-phosphate aminotransferase (isomerizing)